MQPSIRTKILAGVVIVNLLGAIVVMIYLHESYSGGVATQTAHTSALGLAAYEQLTGASGKTVDPTTDSKSVAEILTRMKAITGSDYAFLLDKSAADETAYAAAREKDNLPNNWSEGETYAMVSVTDEAAGDRMRFEASADSVPEIGKTVGVENGACSETCHNGVKAEGDYWGVAWSTDAHSRTHAVLPVNNSEGKPVGVIYALEDITATADAAKASMIRTLTVIGITLLVATLVIGGLVDSLVFKRMNRMMLEIEDISMQVAGGDFDARYVPDGTHDEIGEFEQFFAKVLDLMTGTIKALTRSR